MDRDEKWHWTNGLRWRKLTAMSATLIRPVDQLDRLVAGVRRAVDRHADWSQTARLVADELRAHLPDADVLTPEQRLGAPDGQVAHTLHVEPDGSFSIIALVWRPGQATPIHDHTTWCVFGVIQGVEHEDVFDAGLNLIGQSDNAVGDVNGFAPPGDIHRVHNTGDEVAISVHIYGTDVTRIGTSARRYYDLREQPIGDRRSQ
jgi:predicted metal-dependent enzyme (double-stranded beta helix superfamily)